MNSATSATSMTSSTSITSITSSTSTILLLFLLLLAPCAEAQTIGGNVYGGGNQAKVGGNSTVTVVSGDIDRVFGGARMANVGGRAYVNIDGASTGDLASDSSIVINQVYGGNDIAGTIGQADATNPTGVDKVPTELTHVLASGEKQANEPLKNPVDNSYNAFVRINSTESHTTTKDDDDNPSVTSDALYIGSLFAGGNGDYDYDSADDTPAAGKTTHYIYKSGDLGKSGATPVATTVTTTGETGFTEPDLQKTYLEVTGGSIVYAFGGGNNATVEENTVIHVQNKSDVVNAIYYDGNDKLTDERIAMMGFNPGYTQPHSGDFQIGSFFGGNNQAEMKIRPKWNLQAGLIRNLYSGGNKGAMTSPEGLLLEIDPNVSDPEDEPLVVDYVFGGCRMADVRPQENGEDVTCSNLPGYHFPNGLSARLLVKGGDINNVFGGNDISGTIYGGNAVGIYTSVRGDVYGGGNGAYPYTNTESLKDDPIYGDLHYEDVNNEDGKNGIDALNAFRPNAEQVSVRLKGTDAEHPTVIKGSVFVGGNCATISTTKENPLVELKMGSYVIANNVYLGNNGAQMINEEYLQKFANQYEGLSSFSTMTLTDPTEFSRYMEGVTMSLQPAINFDNILLNGDADNYEPYSSYVGSFFCGGNVGSMAIPGKQTFRVSQGLNIFEKFVGGCRNADVAEGYYNAAYSGGLLGATDERSSFTDEGGNIQDRLELNLDNLTIVPLRWHESGSYLTWNTNKWGYVPVEEGETLTEGNIYYTSAEGDGEFTFTGSEEADGTKYYEQGFVEVPYSSVDEDTRLLGGNVYGGCYESGHVNGNVVININGDVIKPEQVFGQGEGIYGRRASGVSKDDQAFDLMAVALTVFGAGYGENTEIWGSTTVNHNKGYAFQIFGGGEMGVVGKKVDVYGEEGQGAITSQEYQFNPKYSSTVNLCDTVTAEDNDTPVKGLAESEYLYGGGNMGLVCGNTQVNLGNGRIYDAFGGASDADILGHSEVFIGRQPDGSAGFPWVKDIVYGGNDFGGKIHGEYEDGYDFTARLRDYENDKTQLHGYPVSGGSSAGESIPDVLKSSSYVEYVEGRVDTIFGGSYGFYDYSDVGLYGAGCTQPTQHSTFVNIRPDEHTRNSLNGVFGGGTGYPGDRSGDNAQNRSYVLIDIPDDNTNFSHMEVFGAGSYNGVGMSYPAADTFEPSFNLDEASAVVDLLRGRIHNAYGGSYQEGNTRRTVVNVPSESSIQIDNIFGGAYGRLILPPCDVYETQVNYKNTSEKAQVFGAIYGGNNNERRSLFTQVNISAPVWQNKEKGYTGTVYGAGRGIDTWSEHTEVNLLSGARLYNVYGGGERGHVLNASSVQAYQNLYKDYPSPQISQQDDYWKDHHDDFTSSVAADASAALARWQKQWRDTWTMGDYFIPDEGWSNYATNEATNLSRFDDRPELDAKTTAQLDGQKKHNTNVIINQGAVVEGYAYGGGLGDASEALSGDVYGSTYITVLGGEVKKDVYAGGRAGGLDNLFGATSFAGSEFTATANAYIQGGTVRNVYGGGYEGHVGHHEGGLMDAYTGDRLAEAYVVVGKSGTNTFTGGAPAITRNVYGGGEGGSVFGTSYVTLNNGYVGYRYDSSVGEYQPELDDNGKVNALDLSGNVFGGGYVINSYVDNTHINMYGGTVRGSLYGGGELGPIGRGTMLSGTYDGALQNQEAYIRKAGTTNVNIYDGHILRNVFGGGRGKDSWGGDGTMYMDPFLVAKLDMKSRGYVFGQTRVNIHGGEIGTEEGLAQGFGNVFGGGDEGTVYSAYMDGSNLRIGKKDGVRYDGGKEGYYYKSDGTDYLEPATGESALTEDCKVLVAPYARAYGNISLNGHSYAAGDYVPTEDLNYLKNRNEDNRWGLLAPEGITIHNAVFAGGNLASGNSALFVNDNTVFGNATASIHDVYNRDLITIGTGHTGGLYGDGNLTAVDGYRELNITNYGTDKYHIATPLTYDVYETLPAREKDYYELKYICVQECTDKDNNTYTVGSRLTLDEILASFAGKTDIIVDGLPSTTYWKREGVVSPYAGRILNTIQRADFCGVFGSRMVMWGAPDRVPEKADYTNYTINRVREVSLNKKKSVAGDTGDNAEHGNYFGIYNTVNFLGALTSDVKFSDVRKTTSTDSGAQADGTSYYAWKSANWNNRKRNNGTCHNQLALASGVYLELTAENGTGNTLDTKAWGPITGVVELDLINVKTGVGGGYVYAKNQHGVPSPSVNTNTTLTALNTGAASQRDYNYTTDDLSKLKWETSGNFIHSSQTIIDDCYNVKMKYTGEDAMPAHYWYIAGLEYVYDQYISAYTGAPNAYDETVEIPITINASANGKITLLDVKPNRYAYYATAGTKLTGEQKLVINDVTYQLNSPISYWDWSKLPPSQQALFVEETYVNTDGDVLLKSEYEALGDEAQKAYHLSNNISHDTGYLLTYNVTNPELWNTWFTPANGEGTKNQTGGTAYLEGPTYSSTVNGLYGQREYDVQAIIPENIYNNYQALKSGDHASAIPTSGQAEFEEAYVITKEYTSATMHYYPGAPIPKTTANSLNEEYRDRAYVSTASIQLSPTEFIYINDVMTEAEKDAFKTAYPTLAEKIEASVVPAYYCTKAGSYGGTYYENGHNYGALEAYSAMASEDRSKFNFNYDALDLLIDPDYGGEEGKKYQYDSAEGTLQGAKDNAAHYSLTQSIDYSATYTGTTDATPHNGITLTKDQEYTRSQYESLPNEQRHYMPINVTAGDNYVVKENFIHGDTHYAAGTIISSDAYTGLTQTEKDKYISKLNFTGSGKYYYCFDAYTIGENSEGVAVKSATGVKYAVGQNVPAGVVIDDETYASLKNYQKNFTIHGVSPMETSTLYVARNADIKDLSTEKIITVVYRYDYEDSTTDGDITPVSERHVVNIHINFKSGIPEMEDIDPPSIVLPGTGVAMAIPTVTPGAYEISGGGWELFNSEEDAQSHSNGVPYTPTIDPLYWYQDGFYLSYYAKTFLGKYYSNYVPVQVANYHDLKNVMDDKENHLHIDYDRTRLKRDPKIYINDYTTSDPATSANGLLLFKDLFDLSVLDGSPAEGSRLEGHAPLNTSTDTGTNIYDGSTNVRGVRGAQNLEFFLRTDLSAPESAPESVPSGSPAWTPIGTLDQCFHGDLHGDGHHISGLDNSLFLNLCGSVYNLGVTGSFTSAGVVDKGSGYVESSWVKSSATTTDAATKPYAVFGNPTDSQGYQVVNSYYCEDNNALYNTSTTDGVTTSGGARGKARAMSAHDFYNGTVAYNLNNFYLYKRYSDQKVTNGPGKVPYRYFTIGTDNKPELRETKYYDSHPDLCSSGYTFTEDGQEYGLAYVEDRFADGDFVFAAGEIPTAEDERAYVDTEDNNTVKYYPIWPDDYLFFGQKLTYGWGAQAHEELPSAVARDGGRLATGDNANRVFRAPAYFQSKFMDTYYFNPDAYLAFKSADDDDKRQVTAHSMTAIDFAGHYTGPYAPFANYTLGLASVSDGSPVGTTTAFYPPLLDDNGLQSIRNCDVTKNLLVYTPAETAAATAYANQQTHNVLAAYFTEPAYDTYYDNTDKYRRVGAVPGNKVAEIQGHLVQSDLTADGDHLLVDRQEFNAPIAYTFPAGKRMWYQREPENYVDRTKGWEGVSLPFTAELVTTQEKGEITHFYGGSMPSYNSTGTKHSHEYWLREFKGIADTKTITEEGSETLTTTVATATMNYPAATAGADKEYTNTFLWDYYYKDHDQRDKNSDLYQQYYQDSKTYQNYGYATAATPYIIGFPGDTYYEFDLSGKWKPAHTISPISELDAQVITFASEAGATIRVSDDELAAATSAATFDNYTFTPNYLAQEMTAGAYFLNDAGSSYDYIAAAQQTVPFRPYFTASTGGSIKGRDGGAMGVQRIAFNRNSEDIGEDERRDLTDLLEGELLVQARDRRVIVTSQLNRPTNVSVINAAGAVIRTFSIAPGETVETPVAAGVYIVNKKKVSVE